MSRHLTLSLMLIALLAGYAVAHPMGNFSVSHYTRIEVKPTGVVDVTYILDLAELPTFELLQKWDLKQDSAKTAIDAKAAVEAKIWVSNLKFRLDAKPVAARLLNTALVMADGAGNLPIARITMHLEIGASGGGALDYEDTNYPERAGWKEIVVGAAKGVTLVEASHIDVERSKALTEYPKDPTVAPPQDLRARVEWKVAAPAAVSASTAAKPAIIPVEQPQAVASQALSPAQAVGGPPKPAAPGEVVKGDLLSTLLSKKDLGVVTVLFGLLAAFWLGCLHATTPGHGKTMVAAYLVGEKGTAKHAMFLGAMVTFTHTISVFALGIATYFLAGSFAPEAVTKFLGVLSGLSIVGVGLWLLYKRSMKLVAPVPAAVAKAKAQAHGHRSHTHHDHDRQHEHAHALAHSQAGVLQMVAPHSHDDDSHNHTHDHDHGHSHDHDHGPGGHSHVPEGPITMGSLMALGASGGLVPCPTALVLLLSSISIGRIGFGLALLVSFSLGLAGVLMGIGLAVLYAKQLLPKTERSLKHPLVKLIPVLSAGVIVFIGMVMTGTALGWVKIGGV